MKPTKADGLTQSMIITKIILLWKTDVQHPLWDYLLLYFGEREREREEDEAYGMTHERPHAAI